VAHKLYDTICFKDAIGATTPHPSTLKIVAEFAVEETGAMIRTYRMATPTITVNLGTGGKISWPTTAATTPIEVSPDYLDESTPVCPAPKPLPKPPTPAPDPKHLVCRYMQGEDKTPPTSPTDHPATSPPPACFDFQFLQSPDPKVFFARLEKLGGPACNDFRIDQAVFAVLLRDDNGATAPGGKWEVIDISTVALDCGSGTGTVTWKASGSRSLQDCPGSPAGNHMLHWFYKTLENAEAICAKWTFPTIPAGMFREIQVST